jgi:hypothetical protein
MSGVEFDPGFAPYVLAFQAPLAYIYSEINQFKNFSQKKLKFRQYHKKILELFYNNVGFYVGCLMWASYLKTQPKQEIISNPCYGEAYDEEANVEIVKYLIRFTELFPKDMKYFLGDVFDFEPKVLTILELYKEFLIINKGFTQSKYNTDILIPEKYSAKNPENYKEKIDEVLKNGDLKLLLNYFEV